MARFATVYDRNAVEREMDYAKRDLPVTLYGFLDAVSTRFPTRPAVSFQLLSGPDDPAVTLSWAELREEVTRAANLFRSLGVGEGDTVAYLLPNALETVTTLLGGAAAGYSPINAAWRGQSTCHWPMSATAPISAPSRPNPTTCSPTASSSRLDEPVWHQITLLPSRPAWADDLESGTHHESSIA